MRRVIATTWALWTVLAVTGQDITGDWTGLLRTSGLQLHIVFHISKQDTSYNAVMDSPDQGVNGISVASARLVGRKLTLEVAQPKIEYTGEWKDNLIVGTFRQAGLSFPLEMQRGAPTTPVRPQEPAKPYPYPTEEVRFENKGAGVMLAGTLTLPSGKGPFPAVALITGSGPQNRDEELLGHKPFLVIADALTRRGIAVLRYDDRGTAQSTGDFGKATTADLATDVEAAGCLVKNPKKINSPPDRLIRPHCGGVIFSEVGYRRY